MTTGEIEIARVRLLEPPREAAAEAPLLFGVVLPSLESFGLLVRVLADSPDVAVADYTYGAPLFKGNARIVDGLRFADTALQRFDVYFEHGFLNEKERVRLATLFRQQYLRKHPRSERQDLFRASGEVLSFAVELTRPPAKQDDDHRASIAAVPHDAEVFRAWCNEERIDPRHLRGKFLLFLDHVMNPRRHELPDVQLAAAELGVERPIVVELATTGALPGLFVRALEPALHIVSGRLVILPG
jgi:hypothetical protein